MIRRVIINVKHDKQMILFKGMISITEVGNYLRNLRGKRSLRDIQEISGISYTHLRNIEKGIDPRSGSELIPTPEVLKKLSEALNVNYIELMEKAGYLTGVSKLDKDQMIANYDYQKRLSDWLEELLQVLTINNEFLEIVHGDIILLEERHENVLDEGETISPNWLRTLVSEADYDQEWVWDIVKGLAIIAKKHDLDYEEIAKKRMREELSLKELTEIIQQPNTTYNHQPLTHQDRKRILDMLKVLFPDRQ